MKAANKGPCRHSLVDMERGQCHECGAKIGPSVLERLDALELRVAVLESPTPEKT